MDIRLSEVISALSYALDVTEGQPMGHAVRSCLIGMRIGEEIGLAPAERSSLFYALLLKDAGCSSNAARLSSLFGADDLEVKRTRKLIDHHRPGASLRHVLRHGRTRRLAAIARSGADGAREMTELRCERGADIARMIELAETTAQAIRSLDEHWDGAGYPYGLPATRSRCSAASSAWPRPPRCSSASAARAPRSTSRPSAAAPGSTPRSSTPALDAPRPQLLGVARPSSRTA